MTKIHEVEALNSGRLDFIRADEEKRELLEEYDSFIKTEKNLSLKNLITTYILVIFFLLLFVLKIAVSNQIYKKSIKINKLEKELRLLKYQKIVVTQKIQDLKFKSDLYDVLSKKDVYNLK